MPLFLLIAFVVVPLLELWVIGQVADAIALGPTLVLLLVDSILGAWLVRREGSRTWRSFREALEAGRVPGDEITEGAMLLFGGALLLTPGFITDLVGLALVVPATRRPLARLVRTRATAEVFSVGAAGFRARGGGDRHADDAPSGPVAGIEVVSVERDDPPAVDSGDLGRD